MSNQGFSSGMIFKLTCLFIDYTAVVLIQFKHHPSTDIYSYKLATVTTEPPTNLHQITLLSLPNNTLSQTTLSPPNNTLSPKQHSLSNIPSSNQVPNFTSKEIPSPIPVQSNHDEDTYPFEFLNSKFRNSYNSINAT